MLGTLEDKNSGTYRDGNALRLEPWDTNALDLNFNADPWLRAYPTANMMLGRLLKLTNFLEILVNHNINMKLF